MNITDFINTLNNITFIDAIKLDDHGDAYIDMPTARLIWMDHLRHVRASKFVTLDKDSLRSIENADENALTIVKYQKQVLRDLPQTYDLSVANTWQELLAMWPSVLL